MLNSYADVERDEAAAGGAAAIGEALRLHERSIREGYERALRVSSRDLTLTLTLTLALTLTLTLTLALALTLTLTLTLTR